MEWDYCGPQWHTSSYNATPLNPSQIIPSMGPYIQTYEPVGSSHIQTTSLSLLYLASVYLSVYLFIHLFIQSIVWTLKDRAVLIIVGFLLTLFSAQRIASSCIFEEVLTILFFHRKAFISLHKAWCTTFSNL